MTVPRKSSVEFIIFDVQVLFIRPCELIYSSLRSMMLVMVSQIIPFVVHLKTGRRRYAANSRICIPFLNPCSSCWFSWNAEVSSSGYIKRPYMCIHPWIHPSIHPKNSFPIGLHIQMHPRISPPRQVTAAHETNPKPTNQSCLFRFDLIVLESQERGARYLNPKAHRRSD